MTRKAHNSLLLLTTLSVYLGLLVVGGAAPQVFAHSATTRVFEITEEIEFKDDLDLDPDDRVSTELALQTYLQDIEFLVSELRRYQTRELFDLSKDTFEVSQQTHLPCIADNQVGSYTARSFVTSNEKLRKPLEYFSNLLTDGYALSDCLSDTQFKPQQATDSSFTLNLDRNYLRAEVTVRKSSAERAAYLLNELTGLLKSHYSQTDSNIKKAVCETTSFQHSNDKLLVVTILPRAALDDLLANNAK